MNADALRIVCRAGHEPLTVATVDAAGRVTPARHSPDPLAGWGTMESIAAPAGEAVRQRWRVACPACERQGGPVAVFTEDRRARLLRFVALGVSEVDLEALARYISS